MPFLLALFLLVLPATAFAASAQQNPQTTVQLLFADHFAHDMGFTRDTIARKKNWLTPGLNQEIDAYFLRPQPRDEPPVINGDPFTNTQEYPSAFAAGEGVQDPQKATVPVIMTIGPNRRTVQVQLIRQPSGWLVDDLTYEDGMTFRALLKEQP